MGEVSREELQQTSIAQCYQANKDISVYLNAIINSLYGKYELMFCLAAFLHIC